MASPAAAETEIQTCHRALGVLASIGRYNFLPASPALWVPSFCAVPPCQPTTAASLLRLAWRHLRKQPMTAVRGEETGAESRPTHARVGFSAWEGYDFPSAMLR